MIGKNGDTLVIKDLVDVFDNPNHAGFTRTISLALRHGAAINYVVEQFQKDREMDMFSFSKVIARVLKTYIKDGTVHVDYTVLNFHHPQTPTPPMGRLGEFTLQTLPGDGQFNLKMWGSGH